MRIKSLLSYASILFSLALNAQSDQIEVKADGGSFEDLIPWGNGYLGVVQTQAYAVMPKYRQYEYFNERGILVWNEKVNPFNFNNASVCHSESDYAYYVNMPFSKTALVEKTSKTELLNLYQVNQSGKVREKAITYTGELKPVAAYAKKMTQCYLGAFVDGIIFVGTTDDQKYHVVKIDHEFNVSYHAVDFEWDEKLWEKNEISKVKYVLGKNEFSLIQMKLEEGEIISTIKTFDLNAFSDPEEVTNRINFSGYDLNSKSGFDIDYSITERVFTSYERSVMRGNTTYIYPTLGAFTNYVSTDDGLKMYAYYKNIKAGTKKEVEKEGFLMFNLDNKADTEVEPVDEFIFDSDETGSRSHAFHVTNNGEFLFITQQSKSNIILKSSNGKELVFDENLSFAEAYLSYISGKRRSKTDAIDVLSIVGDKYIGFDFDGIRNSYGNTPRAIIYNY